jgi:hypothetical protein
MAAPSPERILEIDLLIEALQAKLDAGATTVTVDGRTTVYDLDALRRRIAELRVERSSGATTTQVVVPCKFG